MLFCANGQTAGRGTRDRSFESRSGVGLYFSLLFCPEDKNYDASAITPLAAAAVIDALIFLLGKEKSEGLFIKWVNDLYIGSKKIAGILAERVVKQERSGYIIGIGINLYGDGFSPEVSKIAASIEKATGERLDKNKLLFEITKRLLSGLTSDEKENLLMLYKERMIPAQSQITVTDGMGFSRNAKVIGIDENFHLAVEYDDGRREALVSGDVSIKL
jgi:BirA family biotin operon repressor/biotin-[acetyl-CoA-carboxylase] ligase